MRRQDGLVPGDGALSRGRLTNHLYTVGADPTDDSAGHGPEPIESDPVDTVRHALTIDSPQRLAIDTGRPDPPAPVEELIAEKYHLQHLLAASPPDRTRDIEALTARRDQLAAEIQPLVDRYDRIAGKRLPRRTTRAELRDVGRQLDDHTTALGRVNAELLGAEDETRRHHQFQTDYTHDTARLHQVDAALDQEVAARVDQHTDRPPAYITRVIGPAPNHPGDRAAWKRGARLLEAHHLGADIDHNTPAPRTALGSPTETVELRALLEAVARRPTARHEVDVGLGLESTNCPFAIRRGRAACWFRGIARLGEAFQP